MSLSFVVWAQETVGAWRVFRELDPITDENTSWMYVDAWDSPVGIEYSPLYVQCGDGFFKVYVNLDLDQARLTPNEYYNATYRMDKGELHEVRGFSSTDGRGLFLVAYPFVGAPVPLVEEAVGTKNFAIRIWDDEGEALTYQMDISGFSEAYAYAGFGDTCPGAPDLATIDPAPSPPMDSDAPTYAGIGRWQWIKEVTSDGSMITLGDGSQWQIRPGADSADSRQWQPLTSVEVELAQSPIGDYRYTLTADGRVVRAKYLGQSE